MTNKIKQKYGPWALITGASSGIGAEFANQLAGQKMNLILVARREERLKALADKLSTTFNVLVDIIAADLTKQEDLQRIKTASNEREVGLLINNAGAAYPGAFLKQSLEKRQSVIDLNIKAPIALTHHFADKMVERKRGGIIFVSSVAAHMGAPYIASYAATKSYLLSFGTALGCELDKHNVDVTTILPGPTRTEMMEMEGVDTSKMPDMFMEPSSVVNVGLNALGKKTFVTPGAMNRMMGFMMSRIFSKHFAQKMFGGMLSKSMDKSLV
ncbi:SDR family NAD(P)-dependent oxidoreductase [Agaribacter marinus]|uniref:Short-chain dehydrogenase n=1 Tax=Agaribacter marinus TaxID=1431249 RepID=A0AA37SZF3_9ALTE|nr:SDR family oxidoreductase [Agaribacter marinus]GLR73092.1 short-chain dehydrogenase [Agaribacter marinus]